MTFSIVARSADSQIFGIAIASSSPAVAARCAHARAGAGVVASQNITDPALGPRILHELADGTSSHDALAQTLRGTPHAAYRQVLVIGGTGPPAAHSGEHTLGIWGMALGEHAAAGGNLLANSDVPKAMLVAFEAEPGPLAPRLLAALRAGAAAGGEAGPIHSAGLMLVREASWPIVDLRVDWSAANPVAELAVVWGIYAPQVEDYMRRALNPGAAPGFGVPGDT
jgi:uncharacterized Ntn-hydrolase superfamily protein